MKDWKICSAFHCSAVKRRDNASSYYSRIRASDLKAVIWDSASQSLAYKEPNRHINYLTIDSFQCAHINTRINWKKLVYTQRISFAIQAGKAQGVKKKLNTKCYFFILKTSYFGFIHSHFPSFSDSVLNRDREPVTVDHCLIRSFIIITAVCQLYQTNTLSVTKYKKYKYCFNFWDV